MVINGTSGLTFPDATVQVTAAEGMTLLGTLITTSGGTQILSGLDLTDYKMVVIFINAIRHNSAIASWPRILAETESVLLSLGVTTAPTSADFCYGMVQIDLTSGVINSNIGAINVAPPTPTFTAGASSIPRVGYGGWTTSTTSFYFTYASGSFDAGSIVFYGVK